LFTLALIAAFFTAFYMFRLFFMVFSGDSDKGIQEVKESDLSMKVPMLVLGLLAIVAGYLNTPWFGSFLNDYLSQGPVSLSTEAVHGPVWIPVLAVVLSLAGIALAYVMYGKKTLARDWLSRSFPSLSSLIYNKYYADEIYQATVVRGTTVFSYFWSYVDRYLVEAAVNGTAGLVHWIGKKGSEFHNGQVQRFGAIALAGLVLLLLIFAVSGGYFS